MKVKEVSLYLLILFVMVSAIICSLLLKEGKDISDRALGLSSDTLSHLERLCENETSIDSCVLLVDKYYSLRLYDKVILYGGICIDRGVNRSLVGSHVNALLSSAYLHLENHEKSNDFLKTAFMVDKDRQVLTPEYLDDLGLSKLAKELE